MENVMKLTINGVVVEMRIDANGNPLFVDTNGNEVNITMVNPIVNVNVANAIEESEYVPDNNGYRRWVMAQMFKALTYNNCNGCGYDYYYKKVKPYNYQWKTTIDELKKLARCGSDVDPIRAKFFTKNVVDRMLLDHLNKMKLAFDRDVYKARRNVRNGIYRIRVSILNDHGCTSVISVVFDDVTNKPSEYFDYLVSQLIEVTSTENLSEYVKKVEEFIKLCDKYYILPDDTEKSKDWFDAFKGEGAYYTLQNMIANHKCKIKEGNRRLNSQHSMDKIVDFMNNEYSDGNGYKLFGILKKCIRDNNFDFYGRMREIYG